MSNPRCYAEEPDYDPSDPTLMAVLGPKGRARVRKAAREKGMTIKELQIWARLHDMTFFERLLGDLLNERGGHRPERMQKLDKVKPVKFSHKPGSVDDPGSVDEGGPEI